MGNPSKSQGLAKELQDLQAAEQQLDNLIQMCTTQFKLLTEEPENKQYPSLEVGEGLGGFSKLSDAKLLNI